MRNYLYSITAHVILLLLFLLFPFISRPTETMELQNVVTVDFSKRPIEKDVVNPRGEKSPDKKVNTTSSNSITEEKMTKASATKTLQTSQKPKAASSSAKVVEEKSKVKVIHQPSKPSKEELQAQENKKAEAEKLSQFKSLFAKVSESSATDGDDTTKPSDNKGTATSGVTSAGNRGSIAAQLGNRSVLFTPTIKDDSQKKGKVIVKICVDAAGKVVSADYTQMGSTTSDSYLVKLAIAGVKKYLFSPSENAKECGRVVVDFQLK